MKRGFVVVLEILVLIALLQSSFVQYLLTDVQKEVTEWLLAMEKYEENKELKKLRENTQTAFSGLNKGQQEYLSEITTNRDSLDRFHKLYCMEGDKNPYIYGTMLNYFCNEINHSGVLTMQ